MHLAPGRRWILAAAVVGLVARLAFSFLYWTDKPLTHDEREYLALASSLEAGRGFTYPPNHEVGTNQRFGRAPGYPAFLAVVGVGVAPEAAPARVKAVQGFIGAFVVAMIGLIAARAAGDRAGALAAGIAAVYPPLVWLPSYVFSEALFMPLALGSVMLLAAARRHSLVEGSARAGGALALAAGLLTGVAILVRSSMLVFLPVVALWFVSRRQWSLAAAFCVAAAIVVAPWTLRNAREHDRFMLVASDGGVTFWTGNHPLARGEGDLAANPDLKRAEIEFRQRHPGLTAEQLEPLYYRDALPRIAANPLWWIGLVFKKLFYTFVPIGPSYTLHSTRYFLATVVPYSLLFPFGVMGLARLLRRENAATPLLLLAASVVLTALVFFPQERFRIPVLDPTLIVCAATVFARARAQS